MNVIVMRRNLTSEELDSLRRRFPDEQIHAQQTNPQSANEHLKNCRRAEAALVFLPHEQPVPVPAMEAGFKHVLYKDGKLMELVRVVPEFKPYEPA